MEKKEYPAAHSTDTLWFAIDECGHVAACWSSESGIVPPNAVTEISTQVEERGFLHWFAEDRSSLLSISPEHVRYLARTFKGVHIDPKYSTGGILFFLSRFSAEIEKLLDREKCGPELRPMVRIFDADEKGKKIALIMDFSSSVSKNSVKIFSRVHELGVCLTCTSAYRIREMRLGESEHMSVPVMHYGHPAANCHAWPYMLEYVPAELKRLDELPISDAEKESLRSGFRLKGCFLEKPFWQPAQDAECNYSEEYPPVEVDSKQFKAFKLSTFGYWR